MELANNSLQIYREGLTIRKLGQAGINPSNRCLQLSAQLSDCVLSKQLNILNQDTVRSQCSVDEWRTECPGSIRRLQIEQIYRKSLNRRLYTQDQLDKYMESKNNIVHYGIVDSRY